MVRKIGDYIHLHWQNYYDHGTYQNREKKTNYSATLFDQHYKNIKTAILAHRIAPQKREKIAAEYNLHNKEAWALFKDIANNKVEHHNILAHLLHQINQTWSDDFINEIIAGLQWDDTLDTFVYTPTSKISQKYKATIIGWPALSLNPHGQFHYFRTIREALIKAQTYLTAPDIMRTPVVEQDIQELEEMLARLQHEEQTLLAWNKSEQQLWQMTQDGRASIDQTSFVNNILQTLFNSYIVNINTMREKYMAATEINRQIQATMAEIFGDIIAIDGTKLGVETVVEYLQSATTTGRTGSTPVVKNSNLFISLNAKSVELDIEQSRKLFNKATSITKYNGRSTDGKLRYAFTDLGQTRAQKRDASITIDAEDYGISIKNTDLTHAYNSYDEKKGKQITSTIPLQNSSLLLYLTGMEFNTDGIRAPNSIATHYLNALSMHPDVIGINYAQAQALQSLKLYILYSALTGQGQLRKSTGAAQILAIYDKTKNAPSRVKLYDMSDILLTIEDSDFTKGVKFTPSIDASFLLKNTKVENISTGKNQYIAPIEQRLTNVLLEARRKNIGAALYTSWLRDNIKSF